MERIIAQSQIEAAINEAYEKFKDEIAGSVFPMLSGVDEKQFGIAAVLTDGTVIKRGDADAKFAMGSIAKVPLIELLLSQNGVDELVKKSGKCPIDGVKKPEKPKMPAGISRHGIRATSAVQPVGDSDGKWDMIVNNIIDLMGSDPELDDNLYKALSMQANDADVVNTLAEAGYFLYDDASIAVDLYVRQAAMKASAEQLASMAATVAADGVNPRTGKIVFDGALAAAVTGSLAGHGPHKVNKPWLVAAGLPAKSGFGGGLVGVFPGVMGIAAYAPGLSDTGFSIKAAKALKYVMQKLGISVFGSAAIVVDHNK